MIRAMGKRRKGLTEKQEAFARELATCKYSISESYRRVYSAENMSGPVVRNAAAKLAARNDITMMVERLKAQRLAREASVGLSDRDRVLTKLRTLLDDGEPSDAVKVSAARLLGQSCGLFTTDISITNTNAKDSETIEAELAAKLESLGLTAHDNVGEAQQTPDKSVH